LIHFSRTKDRKDTDCIKLERSIAPVLNVAEWKSRVTLDEMLKQSHSVRFWTQGWHFLRTIKLQSDEDCALPFRVRVESIFVQRVSVLQHQAESLGAEWNSAYMQACIWWRCHIELTAGVTCDYACNRRGSIKTSDQTMNREDLSAGLAR